MAVPPYVPPFYPDRGPEHNPFAMNGDSGPAAQTIYGDWVDDIERRQGKGALQRLMAAWRGGEWFCPWCGTVAVEHEGEHERCLNCTKQGRHDARYRPDAVAA